MTIINDDPNYDLVIPSINVVIANPTVNLNVNSSNSSGFHPTTSLAGPAPTTINIDNTVNKQVILTGDIDNPLGSTTIASGEDITASDVGQLIQTGQLSLTSTNGNIGAGSVRVNAQLIEANYGSPALLSSPSLQATAPLGDIYLDLSALNETASSPPVVVTGTALAGQLVNLRIEDGAHQAAGQTTPTPQASTYDLVGVSSVNPLVIQAGTTGVVNLSLTGTGNLDISSVTTYHGNISLTTGSGGSITAGTVTTNLGSVTLMAGGSITSGAITAQGGDASLTASGGSITDGTDGASTDVTANNVTLSASAGIGTTSDYFRIDSSHASLGVVTATASQDIDLDQTAGSLNLGLVDSTGGNVALTSAGAITDGEAGTAIVLEAADPVLVATTGIGTAAAPIQAQVSELAANAGSGGLWLDNTGNLTIGVLRNVTGLSAGGVLDVTTIGSMSVDQDVSAPGSLTLEAIPPSGTSDFLTVPAGVEVQSTGSSITIGGTVNTTLAVGAILSAATTVAFIGDDTAGSTVNLDGTIHGTTASIGAGAGNDILININQLTGAVPLTVNGGGDSGNLLNITGTSGNDTFTITSSEVSIQTAGSTVTNNITYSDIQLMAVNYPNPIVTGSQGGNDTFDVTGTSAATTLDCGPGNDILNLSATAGVLNAPVDFIGGAGTNAVNVYGTGTGDTIVMANEPIQSNQDVAALVGAGLQLTYSDPEPAGPAAPALNFTLNTGAGNSIVAVLGTLFPTTIQTGSGTDKVELGGYGPGIMMPELPLDDAGPVPNAAISQTFAATTALSANVLDKGTLGTNGIGSLYLQIQAPETLAGFKQAIAITGGSMGTKLAVDDSADTQAEDPVLTATSIVGLGEYEPQGGPDTITFAGIGAMTVDLGTGATQLLVQSTIAATGPVTIVTNTAATASANIVVETSSAPLVLIGNSMATSYQDTITFDAKSYSNPMSAAMLGAGTGPYSGNNPAYAELTGFGPIGTVDFNGFQVANLNLGQDINNLTIDEDIANLSVNTDQKVFNNLGATLTDDSQNQGDNTIEIKQIGYSTLPNAADQIVGGNGQDTLRVAFSVAPTNTSTVSPPLPPSLDYITPSLDYLTQLQLAKQATLIVNNSASSTGVSWIAGDGELSAVNSQSKTVNLLSIDGASSVQVLGGSGQNALSVQGLSGPTDATISGNNVTLVSGNDVLDQANFGTYNDFSELNQLINFSGLTTSMTSYTRTRSHRAYSS